MTEPTVYIVIGGSAEVVEATGWQPDGKPDWNEPGVCDPRGGAGAEGYLALRDALLRGEMTNCSRGRLVADPHTTARVCAECAKGVHIYCDDDASAEPCACRCNEDKGIPAVTDGPILTASDEWEVSRV